MTNHSTSTKFLQASLVGLSGRDRPKVSVESKATGFSGTEPRSRRRHLLCGLGLLDYL